MKSKNKSLLVVAAHPDDEVLGCGGTIAKFKKKGFTINILFLSDGVSSRKISKKTYIKEIKIRRNACLKACKILGSNKPVFNDLPDNSLDSVPLLKVVKIIEKSINKFKPNIIFTHYFGDLNIDHQIVNKAVVTASRPQNKNPVKTILFFEIPSSTEWQISKKRKQFSPNWFEDISKELNKKIQAINCYKDELRKWPHPRSVKGIKSLANWRGATAGFDAAEAFVLGRKL
jgi:N-acetylglucosamine malate deacetylase 1